MPIHTTLNKFDQVRRRLLTALTGGALTGVSALAVKQAAAATGAVESPGLPANALADLDRKGMQLIITGSGSALPDPLRGGASCAVVVDGTVLQFDCGRRVLENLMLVGINPMKIDHMFFTHMHFDHIADYDYYAITNWIAGRQEIVHVYGPAGTERMSEGAIQYMHAMNVDFIGTILKHWPPHMARRPRSTPPTKCHICDRDALELTASRFPVRTKHLPPQ